MAASKHKRSSSSGCGVQPTLFEFLPSSSGKRSKRDEVSSESESDSDSEPEHSEPEYTSLPVANRSIVSADNFCNPKHAEAQENYVTVKEPSGSTTIIINNSSVSKSDNSSSVGTTSNTASIQSQGAPDIAQGVQQSPVQPLIKFPTTVIGSKSRSFNSEWYRKYKWLEYSIQNNAAFCYACCLFPAATTSRAEQALTHTGYRDWKHATGKQGILEKHNACHTHKQAMISWSEYMKNTEKGTTIADRLNSARNLQIQANRHYMRTLAEVILLCARQDLALRGHRESQSSLNRGNFLEILHLIAKHDKVVEERLQCGPRYTSPEVQNTLLNILANMVRRTICSGVRDAGVFSLLADETKDCSKQEQLAIVLRYVDSKAALHEHFITYVQATSLTAESLVKYILDTLRDFHLDSKCIISQGYDGASVMSGKLSGVQQRLREIAPQAIYIHCYAHTLNLVLVDCVKMIQSASEFFCLLECLYVFISTTKAHVIFMEKQHELHPDKQPLQLQRLSDTRWACRYAAVNAICRTYDCLLVTLEDIGDGPDHAKAVEAKGLYYQVKQFSFIINLVIFDRIL